MSMLDDLNATLHDTRSWTSRFFGGDGDGSASDAIGIQNENHKSIGDFFKNLIPDFSNKNGWLKFGIALIGGLIGSSFGGKFFQKEGEDGKKTPRFISKIFGGVAGATAAQAAAGALMNTFNINFDKESPEQGPTASPQRSKNIKKRPLTENEVRTEITKIFKDGVTAEEKPKLDTLMRQFQRENPVAMQALATQHSYTLPPFTAAPAKP